MRKFLSFYLILFFVLTSTFNAYATHMRAGEITFKYISDLTYEFTIATYVYSPSDAIRTELEINWGDGKTEKITRIQRTDLGNDISYSTYTARHTFSGSKYYTISLEDPNRNADVINIPYSVDVPFYVETQILINPAIKKNSSPLLLNPPIDNACVNSPFIHNPGAFDADGDSLSYKLIPCRGEKGKIIPGYQFPEATTSLTIDSITGDLYWNNPHRSGDYNVAILIEEWRLGVRISSTIRDMQINVIACENEPPVITNIHDTCIVAGDTLNLLINATDPNQDYVTLTATGGPFTFSNPAIFITKKSFKNVSSYFKWITTCNHIRKSPYQVFFKATDDGNPIKLTDIETLNITVIGKPPTNFTAKPIENFIQLNWDEVKCSNAVGYRIYRRDDYAGYTPGHCETGVPESSGYKLIGDIEGIHITTYLDKDNSDGLIPGQTYCYLIIAYFPDGAESYASQEVCTSLILNIPIITNVSIRSTDIQNGSALIKWSIPETIHTTSTNSNYKYYIYRNTESNTSNFTLIDSTLSFRDTLFIDTLINTSSNTFQYKIELYHDTLSTHSKIGNTRAATSIFITLTPTDNAINLKWEPNTPWINNLYVIYRKTENASTFDSIGNTNATNFSNTGLINNQSYCYYIKSMGGYPNIAIDSPLVNLSQQICSIPADNIPPCKPILTVQPNCEKVQNILTWPKPQTNCENANDIKKYTVYFGYTNTDSYSKLAEILNPFDTVYIDISEHSIAGCYAISATDSTGNESKRSNTVCVDIDSCSLYHLPNVFTPNKDGKNDLFTPFDYDFVDHISIEIFNRWGGIVFKTDNPDINWDGKNYLTQQMCSDGVYYYVCQVYEQRLEGITKRILTGYIHLINN